MMISVEKILVLALLGPNLLKFRCECTLAAGRRETLDIYKLSCSPFPGKY